MRWQIVARYITLCPLKIARDSLGVVSMSMLVRKCPKCSKLFWKKEEEVEYADENTLKVTCNHCHQVLRIPLITQGANAGAPKMGH